MKLAISGMAMRCGNHFKDIYGAGEVNVPESGFTASAYVPEETPARQTGLFPDVKGTVVLWPEVLERREAKQ